MTLILIKILARYQKYKKSMIGNSRLLSTNTNNSIISLFSGAGGMDIGFKKASFSTVWANESDKTITPSYQNYFKNTKLDGRSILDIPDKDIPTNVIGVIGGPPCQSWSEAGAKRGFNDPRGSLFYEYIRVIRRVRPMFFVAENVHGIIHSRNMPSFLNIITMLENEDYQISWKLLKASDFGVAQDRKRVFIVGYHKSLSNKMEVNPNRVVSNLLQYD